MKITLNRFLILLFLITSILPIVVLGLVHLTFLHKVLNSDQSFLSLIEHEEFNLFSIYVGVTFCLIVLGAFFFKRYVSKPIEKIISLMDKITEDSLPEIVPDNKSYFFEIRKFIDKFNFMINALRSAELQRRDFISRLSHDIKIPLLAEQKAFELLTDYSLTPEETLKINQSLVNNNVNLLHLINSLLDVLKFESGKIDVIKETTSGASLIQHCVSSLYPLIHEKNISIEENVPSDIFFNLDLQLIRRVIHNILVNAIENSPENSTIFIQLYNQGNSSFISIKDQGQGIAREQLESIFDKYSSYTKTKAGLGLGLYISKLIVERHGGKIDVESLANQGANFKIELPIN